MNTPTPNRDLHSPNPFGKVVSLDQFRATHQRKDARRTAPIHSRHEPINCRCTWDPVIPGNDDPPSAA